MELERPLTLAIDETVELIFCVNNWPFRVRGKVRAIRSETLIGFQFPQLNDRIRRQLEDLIGEMIAIWQSFINKASRTVPPRTM